jgi:hypothetical protein
MAVWLHDFKIIPHSWKYFLFCLHLTSFYDKITIDICVRKIE